MNNDEDKKIKVFTRTKSPYDFQRAITKFPRLPAKPASCFGNTGPPGCRGLRGRRNADVETRKRNGGCDGSAAAEKGNAG